MWSTEQELLRLIEGMSWAALANDDVISPPGLFTYGACYAFIRTVIALLKIRLMGEVFETAVERIEYSARVYGAAAVLTLAWQGLGAGEPILLFFASSFDWFVIGAWQHYHV